MLIVKYEVCISQFVLNTCDLLVPCTVVDCPSISRNNNVDLLFHVPCLGSISSHQVCTNVAQCYAVASQFEGCREKIQENTAIIRDLVRILYYKVSQGHRKRNVFYSR